MRSTVKLLLLSAGVLALAACSRETNTMRAFYGEAGSEIETSDFGNATRNNSAIHSGSISQVVNMTRKFAGDVPNTVNFAFDSAVLDGDARAALVQQANWIKQFPEVRFRVYGHTDLVGSDAYNKGLGLRRARAVVNFLISQGISRNRLEAVASFGETQPLVFVQTEERRNRRTVTEISGFVATNPLLLNGKYAQVIFREYVTSATPPHQQADAAPGAAGAGNGG
ncbi:OmpA family protein [Albidovulum sp.]|uniref:OmpA family protein n=1 Tax=Albidovulum sp. TaxID=1872424 RepID=UPI001D7D1B95|nr:OmpA family protein [Paracoccaceae bacterium]MCC0047100.1 OmpA family protein [Defluviimonas sp.]HPE24908.1 OmpA family protein [Albidovulum sp.]MCB2120067.1 OmpA family protein [Paracoccaceae bacterium]MCB2122679.1 OmpA family protein [Paracoccaceae bacterium]